MGRYSPDWPRLTVSSVYRSDSQSETGLLRRWDGPGGTPFLIFAEPADDHVSVHTVLLDGSADKVLERRTTRLEVESAPVGSHGGRRVYFLCGKCKGRCTRVFFDITDPDPVCRACGGITYTSKNQTSWERKEERITKLRRKLGSRRNFHPLPPRPRGMHRKTYDRLVKEIVELELELLHKVDRPAIVRSRMLKTFRETREELAEDPDQERRKIGEDLLAVWKRHAIEDGTGDSALF